MDITFIIKECAIFLAGLITSVVIPLAIAKFAKKKLSQKIDEVNEAKEFKDVKEELKAIKKEILEMRGKRK